MKNNYTFIILLLPLLWLATGCNPECESINAGSISVPQPPFQLGAQIAVTSTPANLVDGRSFFLRARGSNEAMALESSFNNSLSATIINIPDQAGLSSADLLINDPDCSGQLIPIGQSADLVDANFFIDNPLFVSPVPPLIIIPNPPVVVPTNVVNAWFSPNNRDYCIWFNPVILDTLADGTVVEGSALIPAGSENGIGPVNGSAELGAGCNGELPRADRYYHNNPVSGIVDKGNNYIRISIDRTSKGLGVEPYEGQFISVDGVPASYRTDGICEPTSDVEPFFMYLTSLSTGRQVILFRHPV